MCSPLAAWNRSVIQGCVGITVGATNRSGWKREGDQEILKLELLPKPLYCQARALVTNSAV